MSIAAKHKENTLLFASVILPILEEDESIKDQFWNDFEFFLSGQDIDIQNQLKLLIKLISYLSFLYTFKAFNRLSIKKRQKYIQKLFNFPIPMFVSGLTGLRSLCLFAFYTNESQRKKSKLS